VDVDDINAVFDDIFPKIIRHAIEPNRMAAFHIIKRPDKKTIIQFFNRHQMLLDAKMLMHGIQGLQHFIFRALLKGELVMDS